MEPMPHCLSEGGVTSCCVSIYTIVGKWHLPPYPQQDGKDHIIIRTGSIPSPNGTNSKNSGLPILRLEAYCVLKTPNNKWCLGLIGLKRVP